MFQFDLDGHMFDYRVINLTQIRSSKQTVVG